MADPTESAAAPLHPDGTVLLPPVIEAWLDGHFDGEMGDDADELAAGRNTVAVALWSLMYRQGDPNEDLAALDVLVSGMTESAAATEREDDQAALHQKLTEIIRKGQRERRRPEVVAHAVLYAMEATDGR